MLLIKKLQVLKCLYRSFCKKNNRFFYKSFAKFIRSVKTLVIQVGLNNFKLFGFFQLILKKKDHFFISLNNPFCSSIIRFFRTTPLITKKFSLKNDAHLYTTNYSNIWTFPFADIFDLCRWWAQFECIPWPDPICIFVSASITGTDERYILYLMSFRQNGKTLPQKWTASCSKICAPPQIPQILK